MKESIKWSQSGQSSRQAIVELCGWCTKVGKATRTGLKIAKTRWEDLPTAAQRVLMQHGIQP